MEAKAEEQSTTLGFHVHMKVKNGRFPGIRGATYKAAQMCGGYRLKSQENPIRYGHEEGETENIYIDVYFLDDAKGVRFIENAKLVHDELPQLVSEEHDPEFEHSLEVEFLRPSDLLYILKDDFTLSPPGSVEFDHPVQNLGNIRKRKGVSSEGGSSTSSRTSRSSGRKRRSNYSLSMRQWQSIENLQIAEHEHRVPYMCHLIPRGWKEWEKNPNNVVAATWPFHQELDGLNVDPAVPTLVVEFVGDTKELVEADDGVRHKVSIRVRFRNNDLAKRLIRSFDWKKDTTSGKDSEGDFVSTHIHVADVLDFKTCLEVKKVLTKRAWGTL